MKVLDLGCGRALSSVFLHCAFGVQVWATEFWFGDSENIQRVRDAGAEEGVFPIRTNTRSLPFSENFFDAIVSIDSYMFFDTDDDYLNYLAQAGFMSEIDSKIPDFMAEWWSDEIPYSLHSAERWQRHWERSGILDVEFADSLSDGWRFWRDGLNTVDPVSD